MPADAFEAQLLLRMLHRLKPGPGGCLLWTGAIDRQGYGACAYRGYSTRAHRAIYQLVNGPIAAGLQIDHLCRRRSCCNPRHLEAVTAKVNTNRSTSAAVTRERWSKRTACAQGHEYTVETTRYDPQGTRHCRTCDIEHKRIRSERRAAQRVALLGHDPGPRSRSHVNQKPIVHGAWSGYRRGNCRCGRCRAWAEAMNDRRRQRRAAIV